MVSYLVGAKARREERERCQRDWDRGNDWQRSLEPVKS
jgi:hypothetical protein